jgi:hypothetical protein
MLRVSTAVVLLSLCASCTVSTTRRKPIPDREDPQDNRTQGGPVHHAGTQNAPEITKSVGNAGGVVVLWPRIIPKTDDPKILDIATRVQARLEKIAGKVSSDVDRRPAPERVCPKGEGCKARSLGAVLAVAERGCAVVAVVGAPGVEPVKLVPLAGGIKLSAETSPFREPPENLVTVQEFMPCETLLKELETNATLEGEEKTAKALEAAK